MSPAPISITYRSLAAAAAAGAIAAVQSGIVARTVARLNPAHRLLNVEIADEKVLRAYFEKLGPPKIEFEPPAAHGIDFILRSLVSQCVGQIKLPGLVVRRDAATGEVFSIDLKTLFKFKRFASRNIAALRSRLQKLNSKPTILNGVITDYQLRLTILVGALIAFMRSITIPSLVSRVFVKDMIERTPPPPWRMAEAFFRTTRRSDIGSLSSVF